MIGSRLASALWHGTGINLNSKMFGPIANKLDSVKMPSVPNRPAGSTKFVLGNMFSKHKQGLGFLKDKSKKMGNWIGKTFMEGGIGTKMTFGAASGGAWGAYSEDTSIVKGALTGAGAVGLGTLGARGIRDAKYHRIANKAFGTGGPMEYGVKRIGAAAGGALGLMAGGPVGMAVGAGIGTVGAGALRFGMRHPKLAIYGGGTLAAGAMGGAIVGGSVAQAHAMHQNPNRNNLGADGSLTLGLHSLRHG